MNFGHVLRVHRKLEKEYLELNKMEDNLRDREKLESSLAMSEMQKYYNGDIFDVAAGYAFFISKNHPFIDGNKRIGYKTCRLFLILNGFNLTTDQKTKEKKMIDLVTERISKEEYGSWLRTEVEEFNKYKIDFNEK